MADTSFAGDGDTTIGFSSSSGSEGRRLVVTRDDRIVIGGAAYGAAMLRLLPDGTPDPSFGNLPSEPGRSEFNNLPVYGSFNTVDMGAMAGTGGAKIYLAGNSSRPGPDFPIPIALLMRVGPQGTPDTTFGGSGVVEVGSMNLCNVVPLPDGGVIVLGAVYGSFPLEDHLGALRVNPNGTLDASFNGGQGQLAIPLPGVTRSFHARLGPDGRVYVTTSATIGGNVEAVVFRFGSDGVLDASYAQGTTFALIDFATDSPSRTSPSGIAFQPDGKAVIAAWSGLPGTMDGTCGVARLRSDGTPDPMFGTQGKKLLGPGERFPFCGPLAVQGNRRILVHAAVMSPSKVFALRMQDGAIDASYGTAGIGTPTPHYDRYIGGMAVDHHNRVVLAGMDGGGGMYAARLTSDTLMVDGFEGGD